MTARVQGRETKNHNHVPRKKGRAKEHMARLPAHVGGAVDIGRDLGSCEVLGKLRREVVATKWETEKEEEEKESERAVERASREEREVGGQGRAQETQKERTAGQTTSKKKKRSQANWRETCNKRIRARRIVRLARGHARCRRYRLCT
eukprot:3855693-Rhodomonas_salina.4